MLKKYYPNITPFITNNQSKQDVVEELIMAFQDNKIKIPTKKFLKDLHEEIEDFTFEQSRKTGKTTYGARTGHDDFVMSLCIANHARHTGVMKGQYLII
jgi:phage FluMu gp28-like protein